MNRSSRIQSEPRWIKNYFDRNIVKVYAKWFGVDLLCAIKELGMLQVKLNKDDDRNAFVHAVNHLIKVKGGAWIK